MDLTKYRNSEREQARIKDLMRLVPPRGRSVLDLGARDGFLSYLLAERFDRVVALDLEKPRIEHSKIEAVAGDARRLPFPDETFDVVLCAEVLEHIPPRLLEEVCNEICRVTARTAIIGVPYRQDLRIGRTRCRNCGARNPPWGHVNSFDERRLLNLFPLMDASLVSFVGRNDAVTNRMSARLMEYAGHPYGTYEQEEPCIECGATLLPPTARSWTQKVATKIAIKSDALQRMVTPFRGNWIHVNFEKPAAGSP